MSTDSTESTESLSLSLRNNSDAIDLDVAANQKIAIHYLLGKVRDNEKLLIALAKENKWLNEELSKLHTSNEALAAENVTMREILSAHDQLHEQFALSEDMDHLWDNFRSFVENKEIVDAEFAVEMEEIKEHVEVMQTTCQHSKDEMCVAMMQDFETLDDLVKSIKEKVNTNIQIAAEQAVADQVRDLHAEQDVADQVRDLQNDLGSIKAELETVQSAEQLQEVLAEVKAVQEKVRNNDIQIKCAQGEHILNRKTIVKLEKEIAATNQYGRRENLVFEGIPDNVPQHKLEETCLEIIHKLGFSGIGDYEVVGCHRLRKNRGDSTAPTIIRFFNRKIPEYCKKNRWRLRHINYNNWSLNIREDLCEAYDAVLKECEKLKRAGKIFKVFTHNGFVKVVKNNGDRPLKMTHIVDVINLSPPSL